MTHPDDNKVDGIVLVTDDAQRYLNPRQEITYREHRRELAEWLLNLGKTPGKAEGYSYSTAKNRMNRLDLFYRFVWNHELKVPNAELHDDRLYEIRTVFRRLYDRADRPLPKYFPRQPAEDRFDTVLEDWQDVVEDGRADVVRDGNEYQIRLSTELNDDLSRRAELISKLPS